MARQREREREREWERRERQPELPELWAGVENSWLSFPELSFRDGMREGDGERLARLGAWPLLPLHGKVTPTRIIVYKPTYHFSIVFHPMILFSLYFIPFYSAAFTFCSTGFLDFYRNFKRLFLGFKFGHMSGNGHFKAK